MGDGKGAISLQARDETSSTIAATGWKSLNDCESNGERKQNDMRCHEAPRIPFFCLEYASVGDDEDFLFKVGLFILYQRLVVCLIDTRTSPKVFLVLEISEASSASFQGYSDLLCGNIRYKSECPRWATKE
jgi:hypothetical protein